MSDGFSVEVEPERPGAGRPPALEAELRAYYAASPAPGAPPFEQVREHVEQAYWRARSAASPSEAELRVRELLARLPHRALARANAAFAPLARRDGVRELFEYRADRWHPASEGLASVRYCLTLLHSGVARLPSESSQEAVREELLALEALLLELERQGRGFRLTLGGQ